MVCCVKGKILFNHATVAFQKSLSFSYTGFLREEKWCLLLWSAAYAISKVPLPLWVTAPNCLLPFPAVFDLRNEEKASSQGFCRIILRKPFSLNLHLPQGNVLIMVICLVKGCKDGVGSRWLCHLSSVWMFLLGCRMRNVVTAAGSREQRQITFRGTQFSFAFSSLVAAIPRKHAQMAVAASCI